MDETKFWKTVGAVALGVLVAGAIGYAVRLWLMNQALKEMANSMAAAAQQINESSQRQAEQMRREQERRQAMALAQDQERKRLASERMRAIYAAQQSAIDAEQAKEDAWKRFYQRSKQCDDAAGDAFVECANQHIRAKRKFEALYAEGKL